METRNATTESFPDLFAPELLPTCDCGKAKGSLDGDWHRIIAILFGNLNEVQQKFPPSTKQNPLKMASTSRSSKLFLVCGAVAAEAGAL
jgi:hypothetical protein